MQTSNYQVLKVTTENNQLDEDILLVEAPLQININGESYTVIMRTPGNDVELITGLLYAEDICKKQSSLEFTVIKKENNYSSIINVTIAKEDLGKGYLNKRTLLSVSSCGICGKKELKDINVCGDSLTKITQFLAKEIWEMMRKMSLFQENFKKSGGSHAAAVFNKNKEILTIKEDIGRHNAVDKVIGKLLITKQLEDADYLFVSGRVSYEIVTKAFIAKIPIIVAVSACSSLAVDFAKEFGICLIGFTRSNKMTIYANPQHLKSVEYV